MLISLENTQNTLFVYNIILKDDDGKFWCSTKVDDSGVHIGKKGYWGYCEKWSYSISCKFGLVMGKIQSYINNKLGASGMKVLAYYQIQFQILLILKPVSPIIMIIFNTTKTTAPRMNFP